MAADGCVYLHCNSGKNWLNAQTMKTITIILVCILLHSCGNQEGLKTNQIPSRDSSKSGIKEHDTPKSVDTLKFLKENFGVDYKISSKQIIDTAFFERIRIIPFGKFFPPDRIYLDGTPYQTIMLDSLIILGDGQYKISNNNIVYIHRKGFAQGLYFLKVISNDEYMPDIAIFDSEASGNAYDISSLYKWDNSAMTYYYAGEIAGVYSK